MVGYRDSFWDLIQVRPYQEFKDFNVKIIITNYKYLTTYVVLSRKITFQRHRTLLAQTGTLERRLLGLLGGVSQESDKVI